MKYRNLIPCDWCDEALGLGEGHPVHDGALTLALCHQCYWKFLNGEEPELSYPLPPVRHESVQRLGACSSQ